RIPPRGWGIYQHCRGSVVDLRLCGLPRLGRSAKRRHMDLTVCPTTARHGCMRLASATGGRLRRRQAGRRVRRTTPNPLPAHLRRSSCRQPELTQRVIGCYALSFSQEESMRISNVRVLLLSAPIPPERRGTSDFGTNTKQDLAMVIVETMMGSLVSA